MMTCLEVSSLVCKCVFYRPEHNAKDGPHGINFEVLEMQKRNIPTNRAVRVDEKNGVNCLSTVNSQSYDH